MTLANIYGNCSRFKGCQTTCRHGERKSNPLGSQAIGHPRSPANRSTDRDTIKEVRFRSAAAASPREETGKKKSPTGFFGKITNLITKFPLEKHVIRLRTMVLKKTRFYSGKMTKKFRRAILVCSQKLIFSFDYVKIAA